MRAHRQNKSALHSIGNLCKNLWEIQLQPILPTGEEGPLQLPRVADLCSNDEIGPNCRGCKAQVRSDGINAHTFFLQQTDVGNIRKNHFIVIGFSRVLFTLRCPRDKSALPRLLAERKSPAPAIAPIVGVYSSFVRSNGSISSIIDCPPYTTSIQADKISASFRSPTWNVTNQ